MIIKDTLHILFRRVQPEFVIQTWLDERCNATKSEPVCTLPKHDKNSLEPIFVSAIQNEFNHYTVDEAVYAFDYARDYELFGLGKCRDFGVFGLLAKSVDGILTTDLSNECLCWHKEILNFRNLTHTIDPTIFVAAHLAKYDVERALSRDQFSWNPIVRSTDTNLQNILNDGIAENHFHIGGSSNSFLFSWICLMNHFTPDRKTEFTSKTMATESLDTIYLGAKANQESNYLLAFKAVCIRYFLYMRLRDHDPEAYGTSKGGSDIGSDAWLARILALTEDDCLAEMTEVDSLLHVQRSFCTPVDSSGFIPDYALREEPLAPYDDACEDYCLGISVRSYERRLFRPLAGEQRFLYDMFRAIFQKNPRVEPYLDVFYAYLLIYCRIRGELVQANSRTGFGNFLKFQDRKDVFTENYPLYSDMRTGIAERVVLENPQVVSFEGRFIPADTADKMIKKVQYLIDRGTKQLPGVSDYLEPGSTARHIDEDKLRNKMHFVIHFPKKSQRISDSEEKELITPRDSIVRSKTMTQANAFLEARRMEPEILRFVTGIDACASEIDCRPEVFACAMRKICRNRHPIKSPVEKPLPLTRITYHVGEDFLDPLSGLRAIDEAIRFLDMHSGDRLGHTLALGIDCDEWYTQKNHIVLMRSQELLDNLAWLYGNMMQFDIKNKAAENEIISGFNKLFSKIYKRNQDPGKNDLNTVDLYQYFLSLALRGNDPGLYFHHPIYESDAFQKDLCDIESWQVLEKNILQTDITSATLYHCYHFHAKMKKASDEIIRYDVPASIANAVCELQEKMQYDLSHKGIAIESNPSSNYLIGSFKNYLKHPIFKFNNTHLYPPDDKRFGMKNPRFSVSINTDDLGIFDTSLENEYAIMSSALECYNSKSEDKIPADNIWKWLSEIRKNGVHQSFHK